MSEINTFVFFDTEATGLPGYEHSPTKLTELAFVGCEREHLLSAKKNEIPRVLHKLIIPLNPMKLILPETSKITGLDNYMLEYTRKFDENTVDLINSFLKQLNKPICLVAHNGNGFDYPLLIKQIQKLNCSLDNDLLTVDSLNIFKEYDQSSTPIDEFLKTDLETVQKLNESTPSRGPSRFQSTSDSQRKRPNSSRCLFPDSTTAEVISSKPKTSYKTERISYKLIEIYKRLHGSYPGVAHNAEADTLHLLKCAIAINEDFVKLADKNAKKFIDI